MKRTESFSFQLLRNFLISTLIPFMLVVSVVVLIYSKDYNKDVQSLLNTTISALEANISNYLNELEQITMQPYYNSELYDYLRGLSRGQDYPVKDRIRLQRNLESNMSFIRYTREDINGIYIIGQNGCLYYTITGVDYKSLVPSYPYQEKDWYNNAILADGRCILAGPHFPDYVTPCDAEVISLVRSIVVLESRQPLYLIKIDVNTNVFHRIFQDFRFHVDSKIIIRDENKQIIYSNKTLDSNDKNTISGLSDQDTSAALTDGNFLCYNYPIGDYPWSITVLLSAKELRTKTNIIYQTALILYALGVTLAAVSYHISSRKMITSINDMKKIFQTIQNGDFNKKYESVSNTELDSLGESLNIMAAQLKSKIQQEYIMTIQQKEMEFKTLQAQIQPHFLFNTLNNFIALNQMDKKNELENSLFELSELLRYILKAPAIIPLSMEVTFIENYCSLQKLRFSDRLTYIIVSEVDTEKITIPKLLLQPVIENSIIHGIEPCNYACTITVRFQKAACGVTIIIEDDGIGYLPEQNKTRGIGLGNVEERLGGFAPGSNMTIEFVPPHGTRTTITLCLDPKEDLSK